MCEFVRMNEKKKKRSCLTAKQIGRGPLWGTKASRQARDGKERPRVEESLFPKQHAPFNKYTILIKISYSIIDYEKKRTCIYGFPINLTDNVQINNYIIIQSSFSSTMKYTTFKQEYS